MSNPHEVPAGATWAMARRCVGGRNHLAPDRIPSEPELENAILYVIARKAQITNTAVHAFVYQPNHEHFCGTDSVPENADDEPDANFPLFCATLHADIARVAKSLGGGSVEKSSEIGVIIASSGRKDDPPTQGFFTDPVYGGVDFSSPPTRR